MQTSEQQIENGAGISPDPTVHALLSEVDEFLSYIAIVKTPEVDAIRDGLERTLSAAKDELLVAVERSRSNSSSFQPAKFVRMDPWIAIAAAAALGALIGTLSTMSGHKDR